MSLSQAVSNPASTSAAGVTSAPIIGSFATASNVKGLSENEAGTASMAVVKTTAPPPLPPIPQAPQFQDAIYPSTTTYSKSLVGAPFVNTINPFPPDLVFSINLNTPSVLVNQSMLLHEIDFRIPIGDPSLRTSYTTDIMGGLGLVPPNLPAHPKQPRPIPLFCLILHLR